MSLSKIHGKAKPYIIDNVVLEKMDLNPQEGFIISLIDGKTTVEEILMISSLSENLTMDFLKKLAEKGVIAFDEAEAPVSKFNLSRGQGVHLPGNSGGNSSSPSSERIKSRLPQEVVEEIERMHKICQAMNYYDVLGLSRNATREVIQKAYRSLSRKYHPDQFYLKVSEETKSKLDMIFATISEAYSTLMDPELRKDYDRQLRTGGVKKKINVEVSAPTEISSPKEKAYRLISYGDEAMSEGDYKAALTNYKLAKQLVGELLSLQEKIKRAEIAMVVLKMVSRIEKDEMLLELDTIKELMNFLRANMNYLPLDAYLLKRCVDIIVKMTNAHKLAVSLLRKLVSISPSELENFFLLSEELEKSGDLRGAIEIMEEVLKKDKKNAKVRERVKELRNRLKKKEIKWREQ